MSDQESLIEAIEEAQAILVRYFGAGPKNPHACIQDLQRALDRAEIVAALKRLKAGYGLRVIK